MCFVLTTRFALNTQKEADHVLSVEVAVRADVAPEADLAPG